MALDNQKDFLLTVRDIIYRHGGVIYGGFNRDMILLDEEKRISSDHCTYPVDIDLVIGNMSCSEMILTFAKERGYDVKVEKTTSDGYEFTYNGPNGKIKKIIKVTNGRFTIKLDVTILLNLNTAILSDISGLGFKFMLEQFFVSFPPEFDVNQLVSMWKDNKINMMVLDDDRLLSDDPLQIRKLKTRIKGKIAILMTSISGVPDKRVEKMLLKGFKVISEDKKIRWIDRLAQKIGEEREKISCCICYNELESRWVPTQNILSYEPKCACSKVYVCAHYDGCVHKLRDNKCIICRVENLLI